VCCVGHLQGLVPAMHCVVEGRDNTQGTLTLTHTHTHAHSHTSTLSVIHLRMNKFIRFRHTQQKAYEDVSRHFVSALRWRHTAHGTSLLFNITSIFFPNKPAPRSIRMTTFHSCAVLRLSSCSYFDFVTRTQGEGQLDIWTARGHSMLVKLLMTYHSIQSRLERLRNGPLPCSTLPNKHSQQCLWY